MTDGALAVLQVLHAGRTKGPKAAEPRSAHLMAQWRAAKTFYTTPFGSNDDWWACTVVVGRDETTVQQAWGASGTPDVLWCSPVLPADLGRMPALGVTFSDLQRGSSAREA